jgi:uncharacterized membrane protein
LSGLTDGPNPQVPSSDRPGPATRQAQRVIFIDLARALAVVFMLYGHAVDALLAPQYRTGPIYDLWQFQRGLTSSLFLLLSGFAFSVATTRRWASHVRLSRQVFDRVRRFSLFVILGYALHFPVARFVLLPSATEAQWQAFLAVDVLQLIGATFLIIQLLVFVTRSRWVFTSAAMALAVIVTVVTPHVWSLDWSGSLPAWAASYVTPSHGSLFPLLPWSSYVLLGIGLGQLFGRWGADLHTFANIALILPGAGLVTGGISLRPLAEAIFGEPSWSFVPPEVMVRAGTCLLIVGIMAHGTRYVSRLPHVFSAVAQETLLIYFVHLCIVYGSVWTPGFAQWFGATLSPVEVFFVVIVLITSMAILAWRWNSVKHASPRAARWIAMTAGAILIARLL